MPTKFQLLCSCVKCKQETTTSQLARSHNEKCPAPKQSVKFPGNFGRTAWNKGLKGNPKCSRKGIKGTPLTEDRKKRLSIIAKERGFGGYQPAAGKSKKFKVPDSFGTIVCLQSTYELKCSQILDELGIKWIRPAALKYDDNRNYFADFFLPDFNVYLDPKNNYKARLDQVKIEKVKEQNNAKVFILLNEQLTKEYIKSLFS